MVRGPHASMPKGMRDQLRQDPDHAPEEIGELAPLL
jgi:hypothetical protein